VIIRLRELLGRVKGFYVRFVVVADREFEIRIPRLLCRACPLSSSLPPQDFPPPAPNRQPMDTGLSHAKVVYPSPEHEHAAEAATEFFAERPEAGALLLVGSCARGKASPDSCLDLGVLLSPGLTSAAQASLAQAWDQRRETIPAFEALRRVGRYSNVEVDFHDGWFEPQIRHWTSGPDPFELEIGNTLVYAVPLWDEGGQWERLRGQWLYFQSLGRLWHASASKSWTFSGFRNSTRS
jgi:predicted nucleotidyltransferase